MCSKGNYKQGEKTTLRMGKIIANETLTKDWFPKYINSSYNLIPEKQPNQQVGKRPK